MNVVREILAAAREVVGAFESPGLNGMSNREARKFVNALLSKHTKGFFDDQYWRPVKKTLNELEKHNITPVTQKTEYTKDRDGNPDSKRWAVEVYFMNDKGRRTTIYVTIVASGAGSVDDPLSRYDVVAYAN